MPNFVSNTITIQGEGQIAAAMAGVQMVITRVQVGTGYTAGPFPPMTGLITPIMNLVPQPPQVSANNLQTGEVVVMSTLDSGNVIAPFNLVELGVFARSGTGPEQLIAYCQCSSPYDNIAPGSGSNRLQINLQVPIVVGVGASVSITVQAGNPVYVPPVVAGPGIVVQAPTDTSGRIIEWIVSTPQITNNTTLFVANEYTQNVAPYFSSLQNAMDYLGSFTIASGVQVTINLAAEVFTITTTTYINHLNGQQIIIQGAYNPSLYFSGIGAITGSAGNWQVQLLNVSSTVGLTVGTWLNIYNVSWNWMCALVGGTCYITAIAGSTVTIQSWYYGASWPSMAGTSGWMNALTTIIDMANTQGVSALYIANGGVGLMQYIGIVNPSGQANNYSAGGIVCTANSTLRFMGIWGFRSNVLVSSGFSCSSCSLTLEYCSASLNDTGFTVSGNGSNLGLVDCISSHNFARGIWAETGLIAVEPYGTSNSWTYVCGNRQQGLLVANDSYLIVGAGYAGGGLIAANLMVSYNNNIGLYIVNNSRTAFSTSSSVYWCAFNGSYDVALINLSVVAGSQYIQGSRNFNGTPGVLNANGLFGG